MEKHSKETMFVVLGFKCTIVLCFYAPINLLDVYHSKPVCPFRHIRTWRMAGVCAVGINCRLFSVLLPDNNNYAIFLAPFIIL